MTVPFLPLIQHVVPSLQSSPANHTACVNVVGVQVMPPSTVLSTVALPLEAFQSPPPTT